MPDVYATIGEAPVDTQQIIADAMDLRGSDLSQIGMLRDYLENINLPNGAEVLDAGCGTGVITQLIAQRSEISRMHGLDPSPVLLERARKRFSKDPNLELKQGDARDLPFDENRFDAVFFHTVLCHVPNPEKALMEAWRVLKPGGKLAVFDGDYATSTVSVGVNDPLQSAVDSAMAGLVNDIWFVRKMRGLVSTIGFEIDDFRSYGYVDQSASGYMMTVVKRGLDMLVAEGRITQQGGEQLLGEAHRRAAEGDFFGHIAYACLIANKPG